MKISTKNYLLQSVSQVLSECHRIVSVLSNVAEEKCQECQSQSQELWWDNSDIIPDGEENSKEFWKELYEKTSEALETSLVENEELRDSIKDFIDAIKNDEDCDNIANNDGVHDEENGVILNDIEATDFTQISAECYRICQSLDPRIPEEVCEHVPVKSEPSDVFGDPSPCPTSSYGDTCGRKCTCYHGPGSGHVSGEVSQSGESQLADNLRSKLDHPRKIH